MKKFFKLVSILMVLLMALSMMAACGSKEEATTEESKEETTEEDALGAPEVTTVKWNSGTSKNVLITIATDVPDMTNELLSATQTVNKCLVINQTSLRPQRK